MHIFFSNMNKLDGIITQIQKSGAILLVDVSVNGQGFSALLIESAEPPDWLEIGKAVDVVFKETELSLAKGFTGKISMRNRLPCRVLQIERGELLCIVKLQYHHYSIASAITTRAVDSLQIAVGDELDALVKSNEISLMRKKK